MNREHLIAAICESLPPAQLPRAYRAHSGYRHDRHHTAEDVVNYEADDLGNEYIRTQAKESGLDLKSIPASHVVWVTKNKKSARRYGQDVRQVELHPDHKIIAQDQDEGFLIHNPF